MVNTGDNFSYPTSRLLISLYKRSKLLKDFKKYKKFPISILLKTAGTQKEFGR